MVQEDKGATSVKRSHAWIWSVVAAVVVVAVVVAAAWIVKSRTAAAATGSSEPVIAVSVRSTDSDYYIQWLSGVKKEAARRERR